MADDPRNELEAVAARRWRLSLVLTAVMLVAYFGFVLLAAWAKPALGTILTPGLSLGILLGALVILVAWTLTGFYVRWANRHYDAAIDRLRRKKD